MIDEFPDQDAATTHPQPAARLVGELHELLALPLDEGDYALAAAELGMEVGPARAVLLRRLVSSRWRRRYPASDPALAGDGGLREPVPLRASRGGQQRTTAGRGSRRENGSGLAFPQLSGHERAQVPGDSTAPGHQ
ncbi:hypothetical protein [Streptomyces zaomyceticus]|uniref:hypothetical protein n=1 Tax=Streptomyces zaomyceticus TaxID=68286 RepID=UPI003F4D75E5